MSTSKKTKQFAMKPLAAGLVLAGLAVPLAHADGYELAPGLTMTGFLDMSYYNSDYGDGVEDDNGDSAGIDQWEVDFLYDFGGKLTANVDVEWQDNGSDEGEEMHLEQAYVTYQAYDDISGKAGRFLSYSGWETEDPTGLFQYSGVGYAKYFYGAYQQGVSGLYAGDWFTGAVSLVTDIGNLEGDIKDTENPAVEVMAAFTPTDGLTWKSFYMGQESPVNGEDITMINSWVSYVIGGWTFALEGNYSENNSVAVSTVSANPLFDGVNAEATGGLFMVNYAWDKYGITGRIHDWEVEPEDGDSVEEISGFTISPSWKIHKNVLLVAEYRYDDEDVSGDDFNSYALEALVTW